VQTKKILEKIRTAQSLKYPRFTRTLENKNPILHTIFHRIRCAEGIAFRGTPHQIHLDAGPDLPHCGKLGVRNLSGLIAHVDGGSHGSPGPSGIGVVIKKPDGEMVKIAKWIGHHDNNVAEYAALLEALQVALTLKATALHVFTDSEIVVKQMTGEYRCRSPRLYSLHWMCRKLARSLDFAIAHIPRERNLEANRLANDAARAGASIPRKG
jgi:ribonuclease HI